MAGVFESRLSELGIELPEAPPAVAAYAPSAIIGNLFVTSGQLPFKDGKIVFAGKVGADLTADQGYQAARLCAINAIAQIKKAVANLDQVLRIFRIEGNVHSAAGFQGQPTVLNGASELINAVFKDAGRHTRTALGIHEMPLNAAVQISLWAELKPGNYSA